MSPKATALLVGLGALAFFSIAMNSPQHGWLDWYRMATTGRLTTAEITEVHPEFHRSCTFRYTVSGKVYQATATGCEAGVGQSIQISYLPSDPAFATTRSASGELTLQIFAAVFLSTVAASAAGFRAMKKLDAALPKAAEGGGSAR
jgi:hypothetical protein